MPARREPTMEDVARRAKVSRATVSRVYQDGASVSPAAQIAVREAAAELGYVPNLVASGLAGGGRGQLGLLVRDATNPAYGQLHAELHRAVAPFGRTLVSVTAFRHEYGDAEVEGLRRLLGLRVAGLFVASGVTPPEDLLGPALAAPLIIVGRPNEEDRLESVSYDERAHARTMVEEIAAAGHRRIAVLRAPVMYSRVFDVRVRGALERSRELGLHAETVDLLPVEDGVVRALGTARDHGLTCIVAPVDYVALEVLRAARRLGVRVPEEVSVVGFDGLADGLDLIGLATVRLPVAEVVRDAAERMEVLLNAGARVPDVGADLAERAPARHALHTGAFVPGRTLGPPRSARGTAPLP